MIEVVTMTADVPEVRDLIRAILKENGEVDIDVFHSHYLMGQARQVAIAYGKRNKTKFTTHFRPDTGVLEVRRWQERVGMAQTGDSFQERSPQESGE